MSITIKMEIFEGIENLSWGNDKIGKDYTAQPTVDTHRRILLFSSFT